MALALIGNRFQGGSAAAALWVYPHIEPNESLREWLWSHSRNNYFFYRRDHDDRRVYLRNVASYQARMMDSPMMQSFNQKLTRRRAREKWLEETREQREAECAQLRGERNANRARFDSLNPGVRLVHIAEMDSDLLDCYSLRDIPTWWANVSVDDLLEIDAVTRGELIELLAEWKRDQWQQLRRRLKFIRTLERDAAARKLSEQANSKRTAFLAAFESLDPGDRLARVAGRGSHPPQFFPNRWAEVSNEDLLSLNTMDRDALAQWVSPMKRGPWNRLYKSLKLIQATD
jgi:hypothetical protein